MTDPPPNPTPSTFTTNPPLPSPLPPPPTLPFPSYATLLALQEQQREANDQDEALDLDERSWAHVKDLLKQSFKLCGLDEEVWMEPFIDALHTLANSLTTKLLSTVAESRVAEWKSAELVDRQTNAAGKKKAKDRKTKGREKETSNSTSTTATLNGEKEGPTFEEKEKRRERWRDAMLFLTAKEETPEDVSGLVRRAASSAFGWLAANDLGGGGGGLNEEEDSAWMDVAEPKKLVRYVTLLKVTETTMSAVKKGTSTLGLSFEEGVFEGKSLFGKDSMPDLDEEDLKFVDRVGGTFNLTCTPKHLLALERILELLAFATQSLKLEAHLLRDVSCPRAPLKIELPEEPSPTEEPTTPVEAPRKGLVDISNIPSEEWATTMSRRKSQRSKWNKGNLWGLIIGNATPQSSSPTPPQSSPPQRSVSEISSPAPSVTSTASTNATPVGAGARRIKSKIRGFGEGFRLRKPRKDSKVVESVNHSREPSTDWDEQSEDRGWDFVGTMGLGILNFGGGGSREETPKLEEVPTAEAEEVEKTQYQKTMSDMQDCILSISPGVRYPPPHVLIHIKQLEDADQAHPNPSPPATVSISTSAPTSRPYAKHSRTSAAVEARALAMDFASGTVPAPSRESGRDASVGTACSTMSKRKPPLPSDIQLGLKSLMPHNNSLAGSMRHQTMQFVVETVCSNAPAGTFPCKPPCFNFFDYYVDHADPNAPSASTGDMSLGQLVERLVEARNESCEAPGCKKRQKDHQVQMTHGKDRLVVSVSTAYDSTDSEVTTSRLEATPSESTRPSITAWTTCKTCHAMTTPSLLSVAAQSFSFTKWAELVIYDVDFVPMPELCEHASSEQRTTLVRCFAMGGTVVSVAAEKIELFELRLPTAVDPDVDHEEAPVVKEDVAPVEALKAEIKSFYRTVVSRLTRIDAALQHNACEESDFDAPEADDDELLTPIDGLAKPFPPPFHRHARSDSQKTIIEHDPEAAASNQSSPTKPGEVLIELLAKLRETVANDEQDCLASANEVSSHQLNDTRDLFKRKATAVKSRIAAWEDKHATALDSDQVKSLGDPQYDEPEYFAPGIQVCPESSVLLRENELSSLISLALSARQFQEEVASSTTGASSRRVTPSHLWSGSPLDVPPTSRKTSRNPIPSQLMESTTPTTPAFDEKITPPKSPRPSSVLDPDDAWCDFATNEVVEYGAKPRKKARPGSMLFRTLARQKSSDSGALGLFRHSPLSTPTLESGPMGSSENGAPDDKRASRVESTGDSVLEDLFGPSAPPTPARPRGTQARAVPSIISDLTRRHPSDKTTTSVISYSAAEVGTPHARDGTVSSISSLSSLESSLTTRSSSSSSVSHSSLIPPSPTVSAAPSEDEETDCLPPLEPEPSGSRFLTGALSAILSMPESLRQRASPKLVAPAAESSGHIKFNFRHNDKAFRVTAWHASRFQALRARCGLTESLFVESLSRCHDLNPSGGKSSAAFWMTSDRRFMLKELVTAWGVSERDAFLTFAPTLLDYLMNSEKPSLLAKIFGFYTIKTKNLKTGETRKLDLIVMEHLFHSRTITRQFDLKGVASRVAKPKAGADAKTGTGWDGDWLSGSLENRLLIYSHSKALLREALASDIRFLSENGNIDYSLLVGVDDESKELVIGLIDTLGVFNAYKLIENQVKTGVKKATAADAKDVTVLPPSDYANRFLQAMERYFQSVPDKWSRPPGVEIGEALDPDPRLASVL